MEKSNLNIKRRKEFYLWELLKMLSRSIYMGVNTKESTTLIIPERSIKDVIFFLKNYTKSQFKMLIDICGVDFINRKARFEVLV